MPKAAQTQINTAESDLALLLLHEGQLRAAGYKELADVYRRAIREFRSPAYTGQANTVGVNIALR